MAEGKRNCSNFPKNDRSKKIKTINRMKSRADGEMPDLPEEIIREILLKFVPVKSLLRFRCVCKSWLSLISSSGFIKAHLNANMINQRIVITFFDFNDKICHCSAHSLMFEPLTVARYPLENPIYNRRASIRAVGSCNGLMCFVMIGEGVYLWNPSTGRSILTSPCVKLKQQFHILYGFGYNEFDDDYKIVSLFHLFRDTSVCKLKVKVYSLRSRSWKKIRDFKGVLSNYHGQFASGKLHFLAEIYSDYEFTVVSLDLNTEVFGKVELPNFEEGYCKALLGVLGGCICVTLNYQQIRTDVWVLKEYDVKESWTKLVSIPYVDPLKIGIRSRDSFSSWSKPILMLPSDEILLVSAQCLVIYNPKDNSFRRTGRGIIGRIFEADTYVESLVSI